MCRGRTEGRDVKTGMCYESVNVYVAGRSYFEHTFQSVIAKFEVKFLKY